MKLSIENLGAIGNGTIDLSRKFNLLCGQNGTGKTYFAFVVYGLLRNRFHVRVLEHLADDLINNRHTTWQIDFTETLEYRKAMFSTVEKGLGDVFGIGESDCKNIFSGFKISYGESDDEFINGIKEEAIDLVDSIQNIDIRIQKDAGSDIVEISILNETIASDDIPQVRFALQSLLIHNLCLHPIRNAVIFPVERNSIYTFSKELSIRKQEFVDRIQLMIDKEKTLDKNDLLRSTKRYPLPIKDGLLIAEDLIEIKKKKSEFYEFAESIESELLMGRVLISNDGEIQFKPQKALKRVLPIQMTASIVKTMASLVVYLKHLAKKNDLIIIDEPEINLHPDNQIMLTRILARIMNKGFRLLISTHSDYIIREINNLVMMSHTDNAEVAALAEEKKYASCEFISKEDLNVLVFRYKNKSAKLVDVIQQPIDDYGFDIESIDTVIEEQTDFSEKLYYALKYPSNGSN